jgi:hypothetical protein
MPQSAPDTFAAFVGIDWADATHDMCLQAAGSTKRECFQREHTPEAIDACGTTLRTRCNGRPVAVCLALNTGLLVFALRQYDFLILFPLNPLTLARSRAACTPRRAKDDPTDAALQLELLLTQRDQLPPLHPPSPARRALEPRDKGKAHQAAVRALAFQWLRILSRCGQDRTLDDESVSRNALNHRGSSLIHNLAQGA